MLSKSRISILVVAAFVTAIAIQGCNASKTAKGAGIGAAAGAAVGAAIGYATDNPAAGAIIGAGVGGATGAVIGRHMDKQAAELEEELEGATVERVGEGIRVVFEGGLMFATNSADLTAATKSNLDNLATTLNEYPDTDVKIEGHSDSSGKDDYNLELSKKRAKSVNDYLISKGVAAARLTPEGFGEAFPIADNETPEGMQQNRRVEVAIIANEDMKKAAENGELGE